MKNIYCVEDARKLARRKLPRMIFDYVDGGADNETTLRSNLAAFDNVNFVPRVLVNVANRIQDTTALDDHINVPVLLAPVGLIRVVSREGELAVARAAGKAGTVFIVSTASSCSIEEIAAVATGPLWFQLYLWRDRDFVRTLIKRAQTSGYTALCVAVDFPIAGKRLRDLHNGMTVPPRIGIRTAFEVLSKPSWLSGYLFGEKILLRNLLGIAKGNNMMSMWTYVNTELVDSTVDWSDMAQIRDIWKGPLLVKGIMTANDAINAIGCGVNGIIVSNHGGRQLNGLPSTLEMLPEIIKAVEGHNIEVFVDGGVRHGTDVLKAIALGARACLIGRPYLWGLASGGETGVIRILEIFHEEIDRTLALIGRSKIDEVDRSTVRIRNT